MTDLEMTRLCAEAMGAELSDKSGLSIPLEFNADKQTIVRYDPLHDDAQAMALVKGLGLTCIFELGQGRESWNVQHWRAGLARNGNLNRAIVECVAKMQQAKAVQS